MVILLKTNFEGILDHVLSSLSNPQDFTVDDIVQIISDDFPQYLRNLPTNKEIVARLKAHGKIEVVEIRLDSHNRQFRAYRCKEMG